MEDKRADFTPADISRLRVILAKLSPTEREAITRFYELGQPSRQICEDLGLDADEFRRLKSRVRRAFLAGSSKKKKKK
jgi:DNA-directed RNA polymerase specialized sigma24 family protein